MEKPRENFPHNENRYYPKDLTEIKARIVFHLALFCDICDIAPLLLSSR